MSTVIWWIRRDLRLLDNQALNAALSSSNQVIPLFILDDNLLTSRYTGEKRQSFLFSGLKALDEDLRQIGSRLIIRTGNPDEVLTQIQEETGAEAIYAEADHSPYARNRDQRIGQTLPLRLVSSPAIIPPGGVMKSDGSPYTVFTPFSKAWKYLAAEGVGTTLQAPRHITTPNNLHSANSPNVDTNFSETHFIGGEMEGQNRLGKFLDGGADAAIYNYAEGRNMLDRQGTSMISPYLRFGMLSPRAVAYHALEAIQSAANPKARESAEIWLNEIIWREFYIHILYHFPRVREENFRLGRIGWENDPDKFAAWSQGQTGYPIVDAAMRQLVQTGWMHNRARMIVASFLTKDLLIDWRWGEAWFMQQLVDGDPAANNGGWQWTAGTGTDAAPYYRIFNPISQSQKFDPHGIFIRSWVPELREVTNEFIHEPWKMPIEMQKGSGCQIGKDYPNPIIDHHWARQRALDVYGKAKEIP